MQAVSRNFFIFYFYFLIFSKKSYTPTPAYWLSHFFLHQNYTSPTLPCMQNQFFRMFFVKQSSAHKKDTPKGVLNESIFRFKNNTVSRKKD